MAALATGEIFLFEGFRVERRGLFRHDAGGAFVPVAIGSRALDVLRVLVATQGDLVAKDEIMAAVWPETVVEDNNLTVQISAVRRILDQGRAEGSCIQTAAGRGYRFVPTVTRVEPSSPPMSPPISGNRGGGPEAEFGRGALFAAGLPAPDKPSIAVLPFANLSGDPEQEHFADGMVEEVITALSRIGSLFVIARNSSFTYKGQAIDVKRVGRELGVGYILEGSARRGGDRVRIAAQLIEAKTGAHLWADHFDGSLKDVLDLQDKIATSVVGVIEPALRAAEIRRSATRPTTDLSAYDLHLRALAVFFPMAKERVIQALGLLDQAIAIDPYYGPALSMAAICHMHLVINGWVEEPETSSRKAIDFARQALEAGENDPGVLAGAAFVLAYFGEDIGAMIGLVDRALALNPSYARGWYLSGVLRLWAGQSDLAIEHIETSLRLSPRERMGMGQPLFVTGTAFFFKHQFEEAAAKLLLSIQDHPGATNAYRFLAACYAHMGRLDEARAIVARLRAIAPLVMPSDMPLRNSEDRELFLSGLRLTIGETAVDIDQPPRDVLRTGVEPSVEPADTRLADANRQGTIVSSGGLRLPPPLSIVVLPFINLSDNPDQEYFADAVSDDLTTDLSRISGSFVIARSTAFTYKGKAIDAREVGRELGVRYVLEGSVRRSGSRVRVNAQLIDADTDAHLWAERFDRDIGDLFALQDEITSRIAIELNLELVGAEAARPTDNPDAFDYILRGRAAHSKPPTPEKYAKAVHLFERASALAPSSVDAQSRLAIELTARVLDQMSASTVADIARAEGLVGQALDAAPRSPLAHFAKGQLLRVQKRYAEAIAEYEATLAFNRNWVHALGPLGECKLFTGAIDETIPLVERAIRLSPRDPFIGIWYFRVGRLHLLQSRADQAIVWLEKARNANPELPYVHSDLASAYALTGEIKRSGIELAEARRLSLDGRYSSIARLKAIAYFGVPKIRVLYENTYFAGLRKAGMPER